MKEFILHVKEISFSYERMGAKTRLEKEANGVLEMAFIKVVYIDLSHKTFLFQISKQTDVRRCSIISRLVIFLKSLFEGRSWS